MMDKPAIQAAEDFVHAGYPDAMPKRSCSVRAGRHQRRKSPSTSAVRAIACQRRDRGAHRQRRGRTAALLDRAAKRLSPPWDASRRIITAWTAPSRAAGCRRCCAASASCRRNTDCAVANVFHAGDGNLHPLILYDANKQGELHRAEESRRQSWSCAWKSAAPSPANTASASRRSTRCACSSGRGVEPVPCRQSRIRPAGTAQSRQGRPDIASLRRIRRDACAPGKLALPDWSGSDAGHCRGAARGRSRCLPPPHAAGDSWGGGSKHFYGRAPSGRSSRRFGTAESELRRPPSGSDRPRRHTSRPD